MLSVVAVKAPVNAIVPVVLVNVTVAAFTVLLNVVPPDWVTATVPIVDPTAPTETTPVVLIVKFGAPPEPLTVPNVIALLIPVPTVNVVPDAKVAAPNVIFPVDVPPTVELPLTLMPVLASPRVITPVLAAVTVPFKLMLLGSVAVTPPVNAVVPAK
ncbi:MAG: hypothetical protein EB014_05875, partial [Actinobacteria bacterium]|nr:hypothetical protein [Actinomycetota bacterium]